MLFTTPDFAVFLVVVFCLYWLFRKNLYIQNALILLSSYFFYGYWDVRFLFLIVLSTAIDFCCSLFISEGRVSFGQRIRVSFFLALSGFLFLVVDYNQATLVNVSLLNSQQSWNLGFYHEGVRQFLFIILGIVTANFLYFFTKNIPLHKKRKLGVAISIISNLSILGFFKYYNFFADSFTSLSESLFGISPSLHTLNIILPVGISFYTFQTLSYTIDVYRGELKPSKKLIDFGAYVAFFPQLVAGPIERGKSLLPQFLKSRTFPDSGILRDAAWLIAWGLFKKLVIADNLANIVNQTFSAYDHGVSFTSLPPEDGLRLLFALYAFAFQIYCDFSGYTDIARGTAKLFGFDLMINFRLPYFATDPSSFWRRWHISLSTWLRDYLYISMGGNRGSKLKTYRNLFVTMLLGGLWHGASWTFVVWGAFHGALLCIYRFFNIDVEKQNYNIFIKTIMMVIFFHITCVGWLIFRAQNLDTIFVFLQSIIFSPHMSSEAWQILRQIVHYTWFLILFQVIQFAKNDLNPMKNSHWFVRLNVWIYIMMSLFILGSHSGQDFIYFAF